MVTMPGATRFTGPVRLADRCTRGSRATSSAMWIQGNHCLPLPIGPPTNALNGGSIFSSAPPCALRTMPVRTCTERTASALRLRLPLPARRWRESPRRVAALSRAPRRRGRRSTRPRWRSPGPCGLRAAFAIASTSARVVSTRLSRISFLYAGVQRLPATLAPARFTTASAPSIDQGAVPNRGSRDHFIAARPQRRPDAFRSARSLPPRTTRIDRWRMRGRFARSLLLRYSPRP